MNFILCLFIAAITCVSAEPVTKIIPWEAACDGAEIEVTSEGSRILGIRASALHSRIIAEWTIHFAEGNPVSAEYRESSRGFITAGERAGEASGVNRLVKLETWKSEKEGFRIPEGVRAEELRRLLALAGAGGVE